MARAVQLASKGDYTARPNPVVGCVLVSDGQIVGEGYHHRAGQPHAEINALNAAGDAARGATAYVTLEPCSHTGRTPPCANALVDAGVERVVVGMTDPNPLVSGKGLDILRQSGVKVSSGVLQNEAARLNPGFIKRMQHGMPYVRIKLAMSLDGRTAMASGESQWITGEHARADVHRMRAASGAIMTGSGTILADDPSLTFRTDEHERLAREIPVDAEQPLRVICDSHLKTPLDARVLQAPGKVMIATLEDDDNKYSQKGVEVVRFPARDDRVSLPELLASLAERDINDVMVEAGAGLAGALVNEKLVDELVIYMAPHLMGHDARGLLALPGLTRMQQRVQIDINDIRAIGQDFRITARPVYS